ncbi:MAG: HD domain-containing protein [Candidatus Methanomethylophilaceae archaeon]|nr:HD domain-containing protein [Candidatus Methanomethylophilaceae archaeon]
MFDESVFQRAVDFADDLFAGDSSGHDIYHSIRVHDLARRICEQEGGDMDVVRLSALLHDVDDRKLFEGEGYANARCFMTSENIPEPIQDRICGIIAQISFKGSDSVVPDSLEGRIVQDADRMDAIGAIGIARAFAYGGSRGRSIHVPGESHRDGMSEAEYFSNRGTSINHFHEKLLLLKDMMSTKTARIMAEHRHEYMQGFLAEFMDEWDGIR